MRAGYKICGRLVAAHIPLEHHDVGEHAAFGEGSDFW